jgi:hypothetical protein
VAAERAVEWLRAIAETWRKADVPEACWRHDCMGMNPLVTAALNGDVDSGWHAAG